MKYKSPTITVLHKVDGKYAASTFKFDGFVDRKRVKREIIKAFKRGGETVSPQYIDASITASLKGNLRLAEKKEQVSIHDAEDAHLSDRAAAEQRQFYADEA